MTYQNDPNRRTGMREETSYTAWIVGGILAVAVVLGIFAMTNRGDNTNTASDTPTSTSRPATTTGSGAGSTTPSPATPAR
jgi:hypothetical protein